MKQLITTIRRAIGGQTHMAHGLVSLALFWSLAPFVGLGFGVLVPVLWYWSRETRDAEIRLLKARKKNGNPGSVWTIWPRAITAAWFTADMAYPAAATSLSTLLFLTL